MKTAILITVGFIIASSFFAIGVKIGRNRPPFKLIQATELIDGQYTLMLQDHNGNEFLLTLTIEKALAIGVDTNELILMVNQ